MPAKTIHAANAITTPAGSDELPIWQISSGAQKHITIDNVVAYLETGLDLTASYLPLAGGTMAGDVNFGSNDITNLATLNGLTPADFVLRTGTVALTGDWDIGSGRKIKADEVRARSSSGLKLYEDGGTAGLFVDDSGKVCVGTTTAVDQMTIVTAGVGALAVTAANTGTSVFGGGHAFVLYSSNYTGGLSILMGANDKGVIQVFKNATEDGTLLLNPNGGLVGIGAITPVGKLTVLETGTGATRGIMSSQHNTATTPAMIKWRKSRGSEASPTTVANADYLGVLQPQGYDGSTYRDAGLLGFVVDGSVSSGNVPTAVVINTTASNGDGTQRVRITSAGSVAIGNLASPDTLVHIWNASAGSVSAPAQAMLTVENSDDNGISLLCPDNKINTIYFGSPSNAVVGQIGYLHSTNTFFMTANGTEMDIASNAVFPATDNTVTSGKSGKRWSAVWAGNGTIQTSDMRLKQSVDKSELGLDFIRALKPLQWIWEDAQYSRVHHGLAAQDVKATMDELATGDFAGYIYDPETDRHHLRYSEFTAPIINALQELANRLEALERSKN